MKRPSYCWLGRNIANTTIGHTSLSAVGRWIVMAQPLLRFHLPPSNPRARPGAPRPSDLNDTRPDPKCSFLGNKVHCQTAVIVLLLQKCLPLQFLWLLILIASGPFSQDIIKHSVKISAHLPRGDLLPHLSQLLLNIFTCTSFWFDCIILTLCRYIEIRLHSRNRWGEVCAVVMRSELWRSAALSPIAAWNGQFGHDSTAWSVDGQAVGIRHLVYSLSKYEVKEESSTEWVKIKVVQCWEEEECS